ncbi:MAG: SGNH/GDSL hydrolase family protein, partial [Alphaproteobacteria bacterium]
MLLSLLVAWAALEVAFRLAGVRGRVVGIFDDFHRGDARLGWKGVPDLSLRFRRHPFDVLVEHDADGFRKPDPPTPIDAPRRVLVLGDSLAWGWGVDQGKLLTDELQRRVGSAVAIENRALLSYGTAQEMLLLEDLASRRRYDAVVLVYSRTDPVNDVDGNRLRPAFRFTAGRLQQVRWPPAGMSGRPLAGFLRRHSLAWRTVEGWIDDMGRLVRDGWGGRRPDRRGAPPPQNDFRRLPGYGLTRELLRRMKRVASAHGMAFVVAYEPHHVFPDGSPEAAAKAARDFIVDLCASVGIPFVDVGAGFVDHRDEMVLPDDGHWSAAGHRAVAEALL